MASFGKLTLSDFTLSDLTLSDLAEPTEPLVEVEFADVPKLAPPNFLAWQSEIKSVLKRLGLFGFLDGTNPVPSPTIKTDGTESPNPRYDTWVRQDQLIYDALLGTLSSSIHDNLVHTLSSSWSYRVPGATRSRDAWQKLDDSYGKPTKHHINLFIRKMKTANKGLESVSEFVQRIKRYADVLATLGRPQSPKQIINAVLKGLDSTFQPVIDDVSDDTTLSVDALLEKLVARELYLRGTNCKPTRVVSSSRSSRSYRSDF